MKSLIDRLKDRCRIEPATGCWTWRQAKCGGGHPMIEIAELGGKSLNVRRLMYVIACGSIAKGRVISTSRTCGEKDCINPAHLQSVSRADLNRKIAKSRIYHGGPRKKGQTWHPQVTQTSKPSDSVAGGSSRKPRQQVSPETSAYVAGLLTAAAIGTARKSPSSSGGSCGPISALGQGER